jgi:hypothetical protein
VDPEHADNEAEADGYGSAQSEEAIAFHAAISADLGADCSTGSVLRGRATSLPRAAPIRHRLGPSGPPRGNLTDRQIL